MEALKNGAETFVLDITGDHKKSKEVNEKAAKLMTKLPETRAQELITAVRILLNKA